MPSLKISTQIPPGGQHTITVQSAVSFTPTTIAARGDTDAIRLVTLRVGGREVLSPWPALPLIRLGNPRAIDIEPVGPGSVVEIVLVSQRDTPADVELMLSNEA